MCVVRLGSRTGMGRKAALKTPFDFEYYGQFQITIY